MQLVTKGSYFGAASKFQKASIQTHMQAIIQAFNIQALEQFQHSNLNAYGEF
jgi:hypothetical protein